MLEKARFHEKGERYDAALDTLRDVLLGRKEVDPNATVCGFNTTNAPPWGPNMNGTEWTEGVLAHSNGQIYAMASGVGMVALYD